MDKYQLLDTVTTPESLKKLSPDDLAVLALELRDFIINSVSKTGGHLASSLGAVEITVALHYVFNLPHDKIIWDVGHQCYAHKILSGRKDMFHTLRQYGGLSGFPNSNESIFDSYTTGHASTSISAALGMAKARDFKKEKFNIISVIGDGSFTGGNALEAINQAGYLNTPVIIVLNDNRMSISENVGALSKYTHRIEKTEIYQRIRQSINSLIENAGILREDIIILKKYAKEVGTPGLLFEKLGINYIGPIDGHNIEELIEAFHRSKSIDGPVLVHCKTVKGKGYIFAEENQSRFHGVSPFDVIDGKDLKKGASATFTDVFADTMIKIAEKDESVIGITAAMPDGTGLSRFKALYPDRFYDVGIAEQHAVVFAAGMAKLGLKPVCAIYSTFLQRAYDAIVHDVCLQELPVVFAIDRAGIVGNDGPTHHGCFDVSFLRHIPNMIVMAPRDGNELENMLSLAIEIGRPVAIRYPRGNCLYDDTALCKPVEVGKCEIIQTGDDLTMISFGSVFPLIYRAAKIIEKSGKSVSIINARFAKPLDEEICTCIMKSGRAIIVEENSCQGGFGSAILEMCAEKNIHANIKIIAIPDKFIEHGDQEYLRISNGLSCDTIVECAMKLCDFPAISGLI